jgi:hypothetical protein
MGMGADQGRHIALASLAGDQEILARSVTSETANRALSRSLKVAGETQSSLLYSHRLPTDQYGMIGRVTYQAVDKPVDGFRAEVSF